MFKRFKKDIKEHIFYLEEMECCLDFIFPINELKHKISVNFMLENLLRIKEKTDIDFPNATCVLFESDVI